MPQSIRTNHSHFYSSEGIADAILINTSDDFFYFFFFKLSFVLLICSLQAILLTDIAPEVERVFL